MIDTESLERELRERGHDPAIFGSDHADMCHRCGLWIAADAIAAQREEIAELRRDRERLEWMIQCAIARSELQSFMPRAQLDAARKAQP